MKYTKPARLVPGDTVAVISPSWGGPSIYPHVFENGLKALREIGLQIVEYPGTRAADDFLANHPELRAKDINDSFADTNIKAIIASIGGDDSVRVLPSLDKTIIQNNPKILMGFSDTTTLLTYINQLGVVTFYGPSIMAGFAQAESLPKKFTEHIREMLFTSPEILEYKSFGVYCDGYLDWGNEQDLGKTKELKQDAGWRFIQGAGVATGELYGGCIEVLESLNGTEFWPERDFWNGKILFFETSEEKPSILRVRRMLRNYGMQGIFDKVKVILFGRARDYTDEEKEQLDHMIVSVVKGEFANGKIPIVTNMDFGHTDPQFILPLGIKAEINVSKKTFRLTESALR